MAPLVILDVIVVLLLVVALMLGYQRGVIQPLLAEIFFFGTLLIVFRLHDTYTNEMERLFHVNSVLSVAIALVGAVILGAIGGAIGGAFHRMQAIRGVDGLLGIFVHVAVMLVLIYLAVSAMVTLDNAFAPALASAGLASAQVKVLEDDLLSNPITTALVSKADLRTLTDAASKSNAAQLDSISGLHQLQQIYTNFVQSQLHSSKTVPVILTFGHRLPFIGHVGPNDLKPVVTPAASPTPTASPSPSPKK